MRSQQEEQPDKVTEEDVLRKRLVSRIAVAGVVIVALLGGLAVIDALYVPPPQPEAAKTEAPMAFQAPVEAPIAQSKSESLPTAEESQREPQSNAVNEEDKTTAPETTALPKNQMPPAEATSKPLTLPGSFKPAHIKPSPGLPRHVPAKELLANRSSSPVSLDRSSPHAPASKPLSNLEAQQKRFVVQMGVFSNVANAEELRAKLELNGIPAQIEARVQVGPFKSKQEAEEARIKLAALGLDTGLLMAIRK